MKIDADTKNWIRNASDEKAVANGCRFDGERGQFVIDWAAKYLCLYEGEWAGQPLIARDWQVDVTMRMFGWVRWSEHWNRWIRRFTIGRIYVPKKNKKSPTLAWWGLYLLAGDGEQGQKIFLCAKDGSQAREIAGKHAIEMVQASDAMMADCTINKTVMQITHEPSRSLLKPLSSNNSRTKEAKEGLNGCILVDETHVVDRELMNRVSRAGISRSEPLQIEVSTAGNNPESYGKEVSDRGRMIESGLVEDERVLFVCYEAPQATTDTEIAEDPVKFGKMANPSWGHTIREEEYLDDFNRSRATLQTFLDFKMYRLNIWQQSDNPWLKLGDWEQCRDSFTEVSLEGRECVAALDLARTRDTTALTLLFPEEDGSYKLLVWYWLPRDRAEQLRHDVSYLQWASDGYLTLTEGDETDFGFVRTKLNELRKRFNIRLLTYDDTYAAQLMQRLVEEEGWSDIRCPYPQTMMRFTVPTHAFENLVTLRKIKHNGNKLLTWQIGSTRIRQDNNGNIRPIKQKHGDYRTIDGVVTSIMALGVAQEAGQAPRTFYEHHELEMA